MTEERIQELREEHRVEALRERRAMEHPDPRDPDYQGEDE